MRIVAVIPARMASTRFPGKPMALIHGIPMIGHCFLRVRMCTDIQETYVATCDKEIYDYIESIGGQAVMTSSRHERASDRAAEAMLELENRSGERIDILVMVQGDEPMDTPQMIHEALQPMIEDSMINVVNLMGVIESIEEFEDPNCIKVVCDLKGDALYFSRAPIPTLSKIKDVFIHKQVCIIPFRRDFLIDYTSMEPTQLEITESIDMLRILENGLKVRMIPTKYNSHAVDTIEDLIRVEKLMKINN